MKTAQFTNEFNLKQCVLLDLWELYGTDGWIECEDERQCHSSQSRVDIYIPRLNLFLELKTDVDSSAMDRAIGQALRYAIIDFRPTWIVIPDDVWPGEHYYDVAHSFGCKIISYSDLIPMLRDCIEQDAPQIAVDYLQKLMGIDSERADSLKAKLQCDRMQTCKNAHLSPLVQLNTAAKSRGLEVG
jgi:hypothetical protein